MPKLSPHKVYTDLIQESGLDATIPSTPSWALVSTDALVNLVTAQQLAVYGTFAYPKLIKAQRTARNNIGRITG